MRSFHGFAEAADSLVRDHGARWIPAEPAGSCTDLAAAVLQPLKARRPEYDLAPLVADSTPVSTCHGAQRAVLGAGTVRSANASPC
ncbi:MAG: hypothetical protein NTW86_31955 [Candidatus Sumerlaeota bacterium]|nr:hypothetical protein [Candidatus Sumerlaeota bacterium]